MNPFKKSRKAKEPLDSSLSGPNTGDVLPASSKMSRSLRRKQKNMADAESKPEFDLSTALPDTSDFRTSLLMPKLSARFSMLREQDDPSTKVGKASDDSVLFPRRASRMNLFNHNPLTDIAEVESIRSSSRPPFTATAESERSYSLTDGYTSDDLGNILGRGRPGEGNILFGGRQKFYRIPTGSSSSKNLSEAGASVVGAKHVYQSDVPLSAFQQLRLKTREETERNESTAAAPMSTQTEEHEESDVVNTPSTGFSKNRGTTSSTTSGPSNRRTSTAATSIVSESPVTRHVSAAGFNSRTHLPEYSGAIEEVTSKRNISADSQKAAATGEHENKPPLPASSAPDRQPSQSTSATHLSEHTRALPMFSTSASRAVSPPPTAQSHVLASLDFGLKDMAKSASAQARRYHTASPTPFISDDDDGDIYNQNLQPNDRGKATAMGLFNKPRQQFDEEQFQRRQLQMHEGRISPPTYDSPQRRLASPEPVLSKVATANSASRNMPTPHAQRDPAMQPSSSLPDSTPRPGLAGSQVAPGSVGQSAPFRPRRSSAASSSAAASVHARVESLIRRQNAEFAAREAEGDKDDGASAESSRQQRPSLPTSREPLNEAGGTFFNNSDGSDEDDDVEQGSLESDRRISPARLAPTDIHPALRHGVNDFHFGDDMSATLSLPRPRSHTSSRSISPPIVHETSDPLEPLERSSEIRSPDSPTLGPAAGLGLSGLIRTHLRHDSDRSSFVLPPPSPTRSLVQAPTASRAVSMASTARTINPPESTHSDPFEFDSSHRAQLGPTLNSPPNDAISTMSSKAQQILGQAMMHKNQMTTKAQQVLGNEAPNAVDHERPDIRQWHDGMMSSHHRGESTETQMEDKELGNELAVRARRVQERLKNVAEAETRTRSPGPRHDRSNLPAQALSALRHKTSKNSLTNRANDGQPKAMKMLGITNATREEIPARSPHIGPRSEDEGDYHHRPPNHHDQDGYGDFATGRPPPQRQRLPEFDAPNGRRTPANGRPQHGGGWHEEFDRSRQRSATPTSSRPPRRDRANSEAAERSRSRAGRYREEPTYTPADYARPTPPMSSPQWDQRRPPAFPPDHRTYERSGSAMSNRRPGGPRPNGPGYFDSRAPTPVMTNGNMGMGPPRPSPRPPTAQSPMSPHPPAMSTATPGPASAATPTFPSPVLPSTQYQAPGRSTPTAMAQLTSSGTLKKSVTKEMISEPTFISSTSSVPLIGLPANPRPGPAMSPPVPAMNPRRRGNTISDKSFNSGNPYPPSRTNTGSPLPTMPESPKHFPGLASATTQQGGHVEPQKPVPRPRNRLRKSSSEGGNMAARARQQALASEFGYEKDRSPAVPVFPNRSAISLSTRQDGGMF